MTSIRRCHPMIEFDVRLDLEEEVDDIQKHGDVMALFLVEVIFWCEIILSVKLFRSKEVALYESPVLFHFVCIYEFQDRKFVFDNLQEVYIC